MVFFDNKHKVTQEILSLQRKLDKLKLEVTRLSKLVLSIAKAVERREKIETRKETDDEILLAMLSKNTSDKTH